MTTRRGLQKQSENNIGNTLEYVHSESIYSNAAERALNSKCWTFITSVTTVRRKFSRALLSVLYTGRISCLTTTNPLYVFQRSFKEIVYLRRRSRIFKFPSLEEVHNILLLFTCSLFSLSFCIPTRIFLSSTYYRFIYRIALWIPCYNVVVFVK